MKWTIFLRHCFLATVFISLVSCNSDEGDAGPEGFGSITFNGTKGNVYPDNFVVFDYGCANGFCNWDFHITALDKPPRLSMELFSPGFDGFEGGTFAPLGESSQIAYWSQVRFVWASEQEEVYFAQSGTVQVKFEQSNNIRLNFNFDLGNGNTLNGQFTGGFTFISKQ